MFEKFKEFVNAPIKNGVRGTATVVGLSRAPEAATSGNCAMRLVVNVPGKEPYNVEHQCIVKVSKWPGGGEVLPVSVDPEKPDHLRIEWDEVQTAEERLNQAFPVYGSEGAGAPAAPGMAQTEAVVQSVLAANGLAGQAVVDLRDKPEVREQMFAALEAQGVDTSAMRAQVAAREAAGGGSPAPAAAAPPGDDMLARLEKLGKLRDSGVLTAEEFDAQKKRILGG